MFKAQFVAKPRCGHALPGCFSLEAVSPVAVIVHRLCNSGARAGGVVWRAGQINAGLRFLPARFSFPHRHVNRRIYPFRCRGSRRESAVVQPWTLIWPKNMEPLFDMIARHVRVREWLASQNQSALKRIGGFVVVATIFSCLSFAILFLEYCVLNFGDSDLPPYQPDTSLEKTWDAVLFTVTIAAGLLWLCVIALFLKALLRCVAQHFPRAIRRWHWPF
jgi:hypothetical protein